MTPQPPSRQLSTAEEAGDLRVAGDLMQSSLSRVLAFIRASVEYEGQLPYEVKMAMLEGDGAIEDWTSTRRRSRS